MKKSLPLVIGAALLLGVLLFLGYRSNEVLVSGLPPKEVLSSREEAYLAAFRDAAGDGTRILGVLGTGSMQPYLPAAPEGKDPYKTLVAYTVRSDKAYEDIQPGDLCTYEPESNPGTLWLHQAASKDGGGWIMTGLNNKHYESWMRVTKKNFRGVVLKVYVW